MKLRINALPVKQKEAVTKINELFQQIHTSNLMRSTAHANKAATAKNILENGLVINDEHPFAKEAALRGLPAREFALDIIAKQKGYVDEQEFLRQQALLTIENAKSLEEIDAVLKQYGLGG